MRVALSGLAKRYDGAQALAGVDLAIETHESVALLGPSGCGKSTILRILAGLERASEGEATLDGRRIEAPTPDVALVFQEPRLMPWLTVEQNLRLALPGVPKAEQRQRAAAAPETVGLSGYAAALPRALSGGMAQRAGVARALVRRPSVLLLDEPFSALDSFTRARLQDHVAALWRQSKFTLILVTHDIEEALVVANRVVVMAGPPGRIVADIRVDAASPRDRTAASLQALRRRIAETIADPDAAAQRAPVRYISREA